MAFSFGVSSYGWEQTSDTTISTATAISVIANDLIISIVGWELYNRGITSVTDGVNNLVIGGSITNDENNWFAMYYKIGALSNASSIFTLTLDAAAAYKGIGVMTFHPDVGDTVTLDTGTNPSPASGNTSTAISGDITTSGTDEVVIAGHKCYAYAVPNTATIGGIAADAYLDFYRSGSGSEMGMWYKLAATGTIGGSLKLYVTTYWICSVIAFKSVPPEVGGGGFYWIKR